MVLHVGHGGDEVGVALSLALMNEVSSSPMAVVLFSRLRSASSSALP